MARIMAIDYGGKRTGIAVTDPLQIIATGLTTIHSKDLIPFIEQYIREEVVEKFIIGLPVNWDGSDTHGTAPAKSAIRLLQKKFPQIPVVPVDERYTSAMAKNAMIDMGMKKKDRRDKKIVDEIAATIMLQEYLESINR